MLKSIGLAALIGISSLAFAEQDAPAPQAGSANQVELSSRQVASRIPALMAEARQQIQELEVQHSRSGEEAIQLEIMRIKEETELRRLEILAEECRLAGRIEEADRAEAERERLMAPAEERRSTQPLVTLEEKLAEEQRSSAAARKAPAKAVPSTTVEGGAK